MLCVNPIVPVDTIRSVELGIMRRGQLVDRGLPTVLAQTFRTMVHSRMGVGLSAESAFLSALTAGLLGPVTVAAATMEPRVP